MFYGPVILRVKITMNRTVILCVGTLVFLVLGLIYAWSNFVAPLESAFGWSRSETSFTFSISMMMWSIGMLTSGSLSRVLPLRACYAIRASFIAIGFVLSSSIESLPHPLSGEYLFHYLNWGFANKTAHKAGEFKTIL